MSDYVGTSPTVYTPELGTTDARDIPRIFSNDTRCETCQRRDEIRVRWCPGCRDYRGSHWHRECRCGATWAERSAGHGGFVDLGDEDFVLVCQTCGTSVPNADARTPRCCRRPDVSYHNVREPCVLCARYAA